MSKHRWWGNNGNAKLSDPDTCWWFRADDCSHDGRWNPESAKPLGDAIVDAVLATDDIQRAAAHRRMRASVKLLRPAAHNEPGVIIRELGNSTRQRPVITISEPKLPCA